jgi:hypothetical protein
MGVRLGVSPFYGIIITVGIGVPCAAVITIVAILLRRRPYLVVTAGITLIILVNLYFFVPESPSRFFSRALIDPIPGSVVNIKIDRMYAALDHIFVLSFSVSETDVNNILIQKEFRPLGYVRYEAGVLRWSGRTFPICEHKSPPSWFDVQTWSSPEIYGVEKRSGYEQYLIYNKSKGQAFLIEYKWK